MRVDMRKRAEEPRDGQVSQFIWASQDLREICPCLKWPCLPFSLSLLRMLSGLPLAANFPRRKPGNVPYPLNRPSNDDLSLDVWDNLFMVNCCRALTIHHFDNSPTLVLDIGCGSGYWAVEAAKRWPTSVIIGFDILHTQPDLHNVPSYKDVAPRIKWVHGNFLDGLPFSPDCFDFVHVSKVGLGVPEDEWQSLLEEIARVMKPGAVIEVIEEDPIFPCCQLPSRIRNSSSSLPTPSFNPLFSGSVSDKSNENLPSRVAKLAYAPKAVDSIAKRFRLGAYRRTTVSEINHGSADSLSNQSVPSQSVYRQEESDGEQTHSQDHTRLKLAWDALLSNRFLPSNLLSVLPFYLSTSFVKIKTHPQLNIPLPPTSVSSGHTRPRCRTDAPPPSKNVLAMSGVEWPARYSTTDAAFHLRPLSSPSERDSKVLMPSTPSFDAMHLAKTVNTIKGCKESIRKEYVALFTANMLPNLNPFSGQTAHFARENFESDWKNWLKCASQLSSTIGY
ncbi:hypothetical protein AX15_001984 [Amanita polypyramis BW_CC]|nr:hypothetical protein AX15_001984 [Amanita polypyramis BW_CC]